MSSKDPIPNPQAYQGVRAVNPPEIILSPQGATGTGRAPTSNDKKYRIGTIWINKSANTVYQLTSVAANSATWTQLDNSGGAGSFSTLAVSGTTTLDGNLVLDTAGNKIVSTSVATNTTAGANSFGSVTLVAGTATVSTTSVTASSLIVLWRQSLGATGANPIGHLTVGTIVAGTSFVIRASTTATATTDVATDVSVVGWMIIN
jgi:hypothetical protein